MSQRFAALRRAKEEEPYAPSEFWHANQPKCPHCGYEAEISANDWYELYEEGEHQVDCPSCGEEFTVHSHVSYSFSTDEQEGMDNEPSDQEPQR